MFRVYFNHHRQWFDVHLEDVHPDTFNRHNGSRWGYFQANYEFPRRGLFGEIHLVASRVTRDLVAHELLHLWIEWLRTKDITIVPQNEEKYVVLFDELTRRFWKEYEKQ